MRAVCLTSELQDGGLPSRRPVHRPVDVVAAAVRVGRVEDDEGAAEAVHVLAVVVRVVPVGAGLASHHEVIQEVAPRGDGAAGVGTDRQQRLSVRCGGPRQRAQAHLPFFCCERTDHCVTVATPSRREGPAWVGEKRSRGHSEDEWSNG